MSDADEKKYLRVPYFRKVKALATMQRAEAYLREHIMLGSQMGMLTEGSIVFEKARREMKKALAYLAGKKDDEIKKWIDVESNALASKATQVTDGPPKDPKD